MAAAIIRIRLKLDGQTNSERIPDQTQVVTNEDLDGAKMLLEQLAVAVFTTNMATAVMSYNPIC
jgi:hypothetical protein